MRAPYQTLVFPFRLINNKAEYAIFYRSDLHVWQGINGGGEEGETVIETARRETFEESGIKVDSTFIALDSKCSIPVEAITGEFTWGSEVYVVIEYAFGVDAAGQEISISKEHDEFIWADYQKAHQLLNWDSNKTALWELNKRLERIIKFGNHS